MHEDIAGEPFSFGDEEKMSKSEEEKKEQHPTSHNLLKLLDKFIKINKKNHLDFEEGDFDEDDYDEDEPLDKTASTMHHVSRHENHRAKS